MHGGTGKYEEYSELLVVATMLKVQHIRNIFLLAGSLLFLYQSFTGNPYNYIII